MERINKTMGVQRDVAPRGSGRSLFKLIVHANCCSSVLIKDKRTSSSPFGTSPKKQCHRRAFHFSKITRPDSLFTIEGMHNRHQTQILATVF